MDMDALISLDNEYQDIEGFELFSNFLTGVGISNSEMENLYDFLNQERRTAKREFRKNGFPTTREDYQAFAKKFGIKTSTNLNETFDGQNKDLFLNSLPALQSIPNLPQVAELTKMISALENLEGTEAQNQMLAISTYLV